MGLKSINNKDFLTLFHDLSDSDIIFFYQGPVRQRILEETTDVLKSRIDCLPGEVDRPKYVLLFIEVVQNLIRYSSSRMDKDLPLGTSRGMMLAGFAEGSSFIIGCNPVNKQDEMFLRDKLPALKGMTRGELNKQYKTALHDKRLGAGTGGAGLGLIDIFRKAKNVEYDFSDNSDETLYLIRVEI